MGEQGKPSAFHADSDRSQSARKGIEWTMPDSGNRQAHNRSGNRQAHNRSGVNTMVLTLSFQYLGVQVLQCLQDGQEDTEDSLVLVKPASSWVGVGHSTGRERWARGEHARNREKGRGGGSRPRSIPGI